MGLIRQAKLVLAVILVQLGYAGLNIISVFALKKGMSPYTFIVYRMAIATIVLAPFAYFLDRNSRPPMTWSITAKIMLLSLFNPVLDQNLYYMGMKHSNATFTSAMCNMLPAFAFCLACIFRFEKVSLKKLHSIAKVMGTIITVGGAIVLTLVKGPPLCLPWANNGEQTDHHQSAQCSSAQTDLVKGALFIVGACFCWSWFVILQAIVLRSYPCQLSLTAMICFWGMVEGAILAFVVERGHSGVWSIQFNIKLIATFYGVVILQALQSGVAYYVMGMVVKEKGPVFYSAFNPLATVMVAILGSFVLAEQLYLGSVIGAAVIIIGLYLVLWGKAKDQSSPSQCCMIDEKARGFLRLLVLAPPRLYWVWTLRAKGSVTWAFDWCEPGWLPPHWIVVGNPALWRVWSFCPPLQDLVLATTERNSVEMERDPSAASA
ncbi:WAT1-related protein At2g39510-like [Argentina anserina]|uniref:WAT1-related protein At2g39510-like n=1 Tax=Argentina anserina TaxID=57926 RepID=UPI00217648C4|nr:WAT1-related protein At2g39510-like [Potentilla anserina]